METLEATELLQGAPCNGDELLELVDLAPAVYHRQRYQRQQGVHLAHSTPALHSDAYMQGTLPRDGATAMASRALRQGGSRQYSSTAGVVLGYCCTAASTVKGAQAHTSAARLCQAFVCIQEWEQGGGKPRWTFGKSKKKTRFSYSTE